MENGSYVYDKSRDNGLRYLAGEAFRRSKELAIAKELGVILENPDKTESFELYNSGESERMLARSLGLELCRHRVSLRK